MFEILGVDIYLVAILVATLATIAFGMFWYSPGVFGRKWMELAGMKETDAKMTANDGIMAFIGALLSVLGTNSVLQFSAVVTGLDEFSNILLTAFLITLFFSATAKLNETIWERRSYALLVFNLIHTFIQYLIIAAVLAIWV
jgi:hypothetical protein